MPPAERGARILRVPSARTKKSRPLIGGGSFDRDGAQTTQTFTARSFSLFLGSGSAS